jgi:mitogen-activated protein kinase kinase
MILRPSGPRTRSSQQPTILSLPLNGAPRNTTLLYPDAPRFNTPVPTLNAPKPPRSRQKINYSVPAPLNGQKPSTNNATDNSTNNSTVPSADKTIQAHETYSPEARLQPPQSNPILHTGNDPIRETINKLTSGSSGATVTSATPSSSTDSSNSPSFAHPKDFSDEVLEEIDCLGEGAGGAVHKVRDKRSGAVYARKTITTREVAVKHVVREVSVISSTHHVNIVQCYGVYMSPSSSEVKIVMEECEGGSLEAVGKKIKERGAVVGEKIAGRLAEGVSWFFLICCNQLINNAASRFFKVLLICTLKRPFIATLNLPISFSHVKGSSNCVTSAFLESSLILKSGPLRARSSIWR